MSGLRLGRGLTVPLDYVTKTGAIIAKRRVGKSYMGAVMAEEFCAAGIPWYALDPTSAWWGLRSSADGKKAGLPVVVLGGEHGDVPITEHDGKAIADLIVEEPGFYIVDLSEVDETHAASVRFSTAFLDRLYRRKGKSKDPLHGFWDEGDMFAPQRPGPDETRMLGAAESIVRRGGIRGLGTTIITQRGAVTNKNVLTQLDILWILRTVSPQDQNAVEDYIKRNAVGDELREIMGSLASLGLGECWAYGPGEDPALLQRFTVRERRTFNSSATPKMGEKRVEPSKLADVDLDALRGRLAAQIEKAKQDDPKLLRGRIRGLEREVAELLNRETSPEPEIIEVQVVPEGLEGTLAGVQTDITNAIELLNHARVASTNERARVQQLEAAPVKSARPAASEGRSMPGRTAPAARHVGRVAGTQAAPPAPAAQNNGEVVLKAGARRILDELARVHPLRLTRSQVGLATGMKISGGTFNTYWSLLKRSGYLDESGGDVGVTDLGLDRAGVTPSTPATTEEMVAMWSSKLKRGARDMLNKLVEIYPNNLDRVELAEHLAMSASGGTFNTYLSTLARNGLVEKVDITGVRAHPNLFISA